MARALSKLGYCSRSKAAELIRAGHVLVNERVQRDPEFPVRLGRDRIKVSGSSICGAAKVYLMLNKPRGLVTTVSDEQGRATVFSCLVQANLPFVTPVGRLDKASEGLLLFTNDTAWSAALTDPASGVPKTYHVQVNCQADGALLRRATEGVMSEGQHLKVSRAHILRHGEKNSWLEFTLLEGRNRHIRRLLDALGISVLRLIRVAIGPLALGDLPKGQFRFLSGQEIDALAKP